MGKKITLDQLLKGKATKINDKEFYETAAYVEPFMDHIEKNIEGASYEVQVEFPKQMTITKEEDINYDDVTYNRVYLQATLPDTYTIDNHKKVIGMVYGIDTRTPICKYYVGGENMACTNLCVFNPDDLRVQTIESMKPLNFNSLDDVINGVYEIHQFLEKLHNIVYDTVEETINELVGKWVRNCIDLNYDNGISKAKLSYNTAIDAYKSLFKDNKSDYYIADKNQVDGFTIYNAFTDLITHNNKDIMTKCEKTLLLNRILEI